ncbi:hypothetical protein D3C80_1280990 [compost metagenome]
MSKSRNHFVKSEISILHNSAIFFSLILKNSASFFKREPSQAGHSTSSMNSFAQRFIEVDPLSSCWFLIKCEIPSKSILYSRATPKSLELITNFSFPPFKIISIASSEMVSTASVNLNPNFSPIISSCLKIHEDLYSPKGANPPLFIDSFGLGIIFLILISFIVPRPLQCSQAPFGELKENKFGSGF